MNNEFLYRNSPDSESRNCGNSATQIMSDRPLSTLRSFKPLLIDAYRWATWPYRRFSLARARRNGTVPVAIVFYHRVAEDDPNPWTISHRSFRTQIDWLQRNFDLVSLVEAQRRIRSGSNTRPTVSITFDDGYVDNTTFALPLLIKRGIPVTYFVTTLPSSSGAPFPHDDQCGRPLAPNSLEALRALADAGVEIGGHSRTHTDFGSINNLDKLFDEVIVSTREVEQAIGRKIRFFALPFGQLENLHPEAFRLAKVHGFHGVCTAFGGWNEIGGNEFHLQRFHGDPRLSYLKNWLTLDPRKRNLKHNHAVNQMIETVLQEQRDQQARALQDQTQKDRTQLDQPPIGPGPVQVPLQPSDQCLPSPQESDTCH